MRESVFSKKNASLTLMSLARKRCGTTCGTASPASFKFVVGLLVTAIDTALHYATRTYRERSTQRNRAIETIMVGA